MYYKSIIHFLKKVILTTLIFIFHVPQKTFLLFREFRDINWELQTLSSG